MDDNQKLQFLEDAVKNAEATHGPGSIELAIALENYAQFLKAKKSRALDAANMKARADAIRSKLPAQNQAAIAPVSKDLKSTRSDPSVQLEKVKVKKYHGNEVEAASWFQRDAVKMAELGYYPTSQVWAPGSYGCGAFIVALLLCWILIGFVIFIYMLLVKPSGTLTVTYELREKVDLKPAATPVNEKVCPRCAENVKAAAKVCRFCGHNFENEFGQVD